VEKSPLFLTKIFSMLQVQSFTFNPFQENTYVLYDETGECVIVDAGCMEDEEALDLADFIQDRNLSVRWLLNTHSHVDHVLGNFFVKKKYGVPLLIHPLDEPTRKAVTAYAPAYGFHHYQEVLPDAFLDEAKPVLFGNQSLRVIFVPGHSPGHVAFYDEADGLLIGGDVLFYNSIGRTDLPGGNFDTLMDSIRHKLFTLPDDVKVYPGHGPETTIGYEKRTNPFCAVTRARANG
jgi:glyoxylase-like metal-dependent hydrolase (beta-lactamase superfamily II)